MRRMLLAAMVAACSDDGATPRDAALDVADAEVVPDSTITSGPWATPTLIGIPPPTDTDDDVTLTADLRELYINSARNGNFDVFVLRRDSATAAWGPLVLVPFVSTLQIETTPKIHPDGLSLTFARDPTQTGMYELFEAKRASRTAPWGTPVPLTDLDSAASDYGASMTADRRTVVFASTRLDPANTELFIADRASPDVPFDVPVHLTAVGSPVHDGSPWISADGLTLYFESTRDGTSDFFLARRASRSDVFGGVERIVELSSASSEQDIWVSPDGRHVTFTSNRNGTNQLWESSR